MFALRAGLAAAPLAHAHDVMRLGGEVPNRKNAHGRWGDVTIASLCLLLFSGLLVGISTEFGKYRDWLEGAAVSLFVAALIALIIDRLSLAKLEGELKEHIGSLLDGRQLREFGLVRVGSQVPYEEITRSLSGATEFEIVQTWTSYLTHTNDAIHRFILRGGRVRIHLLSPSSPVSAIRSISSNENETFVSTKVCEIAQRLKNLHSSIETSQLVSELDDKLQLYFYDCLPSFAIYRVDNRVWIALYWKGQLSDEPMYLELDTSPNTEMRNLIRRQISSVRVDSDQVNLKASFPKENRFSFIERESQSANSSVTTWLNRFWQRRIT